MLYGCDITFGRPREVSGLPAPALPIIVCRPGLCVSECLVSSYLPRVWHVVTDIRGSVNPFILSGFPVLPNVPLFGCWIYLVAHVLDIFGSACPVERVADRFIGRGGVH